MAPKQEPESAVRDRAILSEDLSEIDVPNHDILDSLQDTGQIVYHSRLIDDLIAWPRDEGSAIYLSTYSWCWGLYQAIRPCKMVIGINYKSPHPNPHIRFCSKNHSKIYLFFRAHQCVRAVVGSSNLTEASMFNLNIAVTHPATLKQLCQSYDILWKTSRPVVSSSLSPSASPSTKSLSGKGTWSAFSTTPITPPLDTSPEPGSKSLPGTEL